MERRLARRAEIQEGGKNRRAPVGQSRSADARLRIGARMAAAVCW